MLTYGLTITTFSRRERILADLIGDVKRAIANQFGPPYSNKNVDAWEKHLRALMYDSVLRQAATVDTRGDTAQTDRLLAEETKEMVAALAQKAAAHVHGPIAEIYFSDKSITEYVTSVAGFEKVDWENEADPSVAGALKMAWANYMRLNSAIVCFIMVNNIVAEFTNHRRDSSGDEMYEAIHNDLYTRRHEFMTDILTFAILTSDRKEIAKAIKLRLNTAIISDDDFTNFSVMQFLQPYGVHPGRYPTATNDAFIADVQKRYSELKNDAS